MDLITGVIPGYVAGAVDAANIGVEHYLKNVKA